MSKVVAVLYKPDNCYACPFCAYYDKYCALAERKLESTKYKKRSDWCPLIDAPEKKETWEMDVVHHESADLCERVGWNKCVDYILGEENMDEYS